MSSNRGNSNTEPLMSPATLKDGFALFKWRNSHAVRKYFESPIKNTYFNHFSWYYRYLHSKDRGKMFFFFINSKRCGMTRLDRLSNLNEYEISILVPPKFQAKGIGRKLLELTMGAAGEELGAQRIIARVNRVNGQSHRLFYAYGFKEYSSDDFYDYLDFTID